MATTGYAIHLNGTTQYFTVADDASHDYATANNFTFGLCFRLDWDYQTQAKPQYLWSRQNQHAMYIDHGELFYYFNGAGGAQTWKTGIKVVPDKTYHLVLTGTESTNTTVVLYLNGEAKASKLLTGGMPADTNTALYVGVDYGHSTAGQFMKGYICGWYQSNTTAITAANVLTAYNSGAYDIDTIEAITGLVDSVGFEENTGTTYDNALNADLDGSGQGTPLWTAAVDPGLRVTNGMELNFSAVGETYGKRIVVDNVLWEGDAIADGDILELTDKSGKTVFHSISKTDDTGIDKEFERERFWDGVTVKTLGHGNVRITLS